MKSSLATTAWTMALALAVWWLNYQFVTPGVPLSGQEDLLLVLACWILVVLTRKVYARVRPAKETRR